MSTADKKKSFILTKFIALLAVIIAFFFITNTVVAAKNSMSPISLTPKSDDLVLMVFGQSHPGNSMDVLQTSGVSSSFKYNPLDGNFYKSADPLPDGSGGGGSFLTLVGHQYDSLKSKPWTRLIIVPGIANGTGSSEWLPSKGVLLQDKVITPYKTLISEGYKPSQIVGMWIQGSSDVNSGVSAEKYEANWSTILATIRNAGIDMPIFIARTTHCRLNDGAELELVNQTQRVAKLKTQSIIHDTLGRLPDAKLGTYPGPNLDFIGSSGRHDYCHFNGWGGQVAAELTLQVLLDSVDIIDRVNEPEIPIEYTNTVDDNYVDSNENSDSFIEETTEETSDSVTLSELIELFISLGIIAPDKADAARQTILQPPGTEDNTSCLILKYDLYLGRSDSETDGEVSKLQNFLQQTGDYTYPEITGYYGPSTQEAVQSWQARNGVVSSGSPETTGYGVVGPKTRAAISQNCTTPLKPKIASTFSITLDSDYADNDVRTVRNVIPAAKISTSGSRVRVKFIQNSGTGGRAISNASIVEQNSGAKGATVPTRLTFDNANKVTLVNSAPLWSDWIDFTLDEKKSYLITWDQPGSNTMRGRQKTGSGYGAYSATDQRAMQQSNSGFLLISRDVTIGVSEIEVADSQLDEISGPEAGVGSI